MDCDDGDPCTTDECVDGRCVNTPMDCDDGDPCTTDECVDGHCVNTPMDCDDGDLCTTDECVDGHCVNTPMDCDDDDPCTINRCVDGHCVDTPMDCDDDDPCTTDECVDGHCVNTPMDCDDGDPCTTDECVDGHCVNTPMDCDDGDPCTTDECVGGHCVNTPMDCDDGNLCTTDECIGGHCVNTPKNCDDGDRCTEDSCNPFTGQCIHTPIPGCCYNGRCRHGDVDCDGRICFDDVVCIYLRFVRGYFPMYCAGSVPGAEQRADVNCDGVINLRDAWFLQMHLFFCWSIPQCCSPTGGHKLSEQWPSPAETYALAVGHVRSEAGKRIEVPIRVENPRDLKAFGMKVTYPRELLTFQEVNNGSGTEEWVVVDGYETSPGTITLAGFHTEPIQSESPTVIATLVFDVQDGAGPASGELAVVDLMEDVSQAVAMNGHISVDADIPSLYVLKQNAPNPFNPDTEIQFALPEAAKVNVTVYNTVGQVVEVLVNSKMEAGYHAVRWSGENVASGIYFYRMEAGNFVCTRAMILMK